MSGITLSILDVGHGNSAVLVDTEGVVVIDCGPGTALLEFIRQAAIDQIDVLLISHADKDHIEGVISLVESRQCKIGQVRLNSDALKRSKLWGDLVYLLEEFELGVELTTRQSEEFDQGQISIRVLAPRPALAAIGPGGNDKKGRRLTSNSTSAVIKLMHNETAVALFPGDIDEVGLENMLEDKQDMAAPIVVFPHHGGKSGSRDIEAFARQFCQAVSPDTVLFSIGRRKYDTPQPSVVAAVRESLPGVRVACTQLSKRCTDELPRTPPGHLTAAFARGKEHCECCGGTFTVLLDGALPRLLPDREEHASFIRDVASRSLCLRELE